eukprot:366260-Chlamydomonas_euryale.AAC.6
MLCAWPGMEELLLALCPRLPPRCATTRGQSSHLIHTSTHRHIEALRPPGTAELLLAQPDGGILEGLVTNFCVIQRKRTEEHVFLDPAQKGERLESKPTPPLPPPPSLSTLRFAPIHPPGPSTHYAAGPCLHARAPHRGRRSARYAAGDMRAIDSHAPRHHARAGDRGGGGVGSGCGVGAARDLRARALERGLCDKLVG